jgi:hypothetical protein
MTFQDITVKDISKEKYRNKNAMPRSAISPSDYEYIHAYGAALDDEIARKCTCDC